VALLGEGQEAAGCGLPVYAEFDALMREHRGLDGLFCFRESVVDSATLVTGC
jgi:hypothetical protein